MKKYHLAAQRSSEGGRRHTIIAEGNAYEIYSTGEGGISKIPSDVIEAFQFYARQRINKDKGLTSIALNITEN